MKPESTINQCKDIEYRIEDENGTFEIQRNWIRADSCLWIKEQIYLSNQPYNNNSNGK